MVCKFCGKTQFPHSFGRFARNYAETASFHQISTPRNCVQLRYFTQWQIDLDNHQTNTTFLYQQGIHLILPRVKTYL